MRTVRQSRWDSAADYDWLGEGDIPADPLADFAGTSDNCLSVWFLDDQMTDLDHLVAALAATRERTDKLDYVVFPESHLQNAGIEVCTTCGRTPDDQINSHHRDLIHLSGTKVLALTHRVCATNLGLKRVDARRILQLIADAVRHGRIPLERIGPNLRDDVRACLGAADPGPPKPK